MQKEAQSDGAVSTLGSTEIPPQSRLLMQKSKRLTANPIIRMRPEDRLGVKRLPTGHKLLLTSSRKEITIIGQELGQGGQSTVYQVDMDGVPYALKWYHPEYRMRDNRLRDRLKRIIGSPIDGRSLWPIDIVDGSERTLWYNTIKTADTVRQTAAKQPI